MGRTWGQAGCPFGHMAAYRAQSGGGVQASVLWFPGLPRGNSWREGPAVMQATGGVWLPWDPPQWSKPRALCPSGCYPQCPKDRPIYDEDLKQCVPADKCGCYVGDTRYPPGGSVPTDKDCQSWYLSSRARPGGGQTHPHACHALTHARVRTRPHLWAAGARAWGHELLSTGSLLCPPLVASPRPPPLLTVRTGRRTRSRRRAGGQGGGPGGARPWGLNSALALQCVYQHLGSRLPARRR